MKWPLSKETHSPVVLLYSGQQQTIGHNDTKGTYLWGKMVAAQIHSCLTILNPPNGIWGTRHTRFRYMPYCEKITLENLAIDKFITE